MVRKLGNIELNRYTVSLAVLFLFGFAVFAYPFVCNWWYQMQADAQIAAYTETIGEQTKSSDSVYDAAFVDAEDYNETLVGQVVPDVFAIREGTTDADYESRLNVLGDQMMGSVEIPAINVSLPIFHYSTEETLLKGCGHIFGSSLPVGGKSSHAVITAHRGLPSAAMFSDLDQVRLGDHFYLHILNRVLAYEVDNIEVVQPEETRSLAIAEGKDLVTLVTCTPYGVNTERLLVRGHRVDFDPNADADTGIRPFGLLTKVGVAAAGVVAALVVLWLINKVRARRSSASAAMAGNAGFVDAEILETNETGASYSSGEKVAKARHRA